MTTKDNILEILQKSATKNGADECEIHLFNTKRSLMRMANNKIIGNSMDENSEVYIRLAVGNKIGESFSNSIEEESLAESIKIALMVAQNAVPNKYYNGFSREIIKSENSQYSSDIAELSQEKKSELLKKLFDKALSDNLNVAGCFNTQQSNSYYVNSHGINNTYSGTQCLLNLITTGEHLSGFSNYFDWNLKEFDIEKIYNESAEKCRFNSLPKEIPLGAYDVILSPEALSLVLHWLSMIGFSSQSFEERMSFLYDNYGKMVAGSNITIYDDGFDTNGMVCPFDYEGRKKKKVYFIKDGVAKDFVFDSESGIRNGKESTGHRAIDVDYPSDRSAFPHNIFFTSGKNTIDEMVGSVKKGLYITRFHYINGLLNPSIALMTGLTRDGTFYIEDGKIKYPAKNLRFTESIVEAFNRVRMISKDQKKCHFLDGKSSSIVAPSVLISDFQFTGHQKE